MKFKNLFTSIALLATIFSFSQSKNSNGVVNKTVKVENVGISVTVDSAEEIESTFKLEDMNEVLDLSSDNEELSFEIICNGKKMKNGVKSHISYKVEGNANDRDNFLNSVKIIRSAAINYYKNKN